MTGTQVAAALLALQVIPGAAGSSGGGQQQEQQLPLPAEVPQLGPELERLLQQPGSNAQELYELWQQGVPLEALGSMHSSGNMPVNAVGFYSKLSITYVVQLQMTDTGSSVHNNAAFLSGQCSCLLADPCIQVYTCAWKPLHTCT